MGDWLSEALERARKEEKYFLVIDIEKYFPIARGAQIQFANERIEQHQRKYEREVLMQFANIENVARMKELAEQILQEVERIKSLGPTPCEIKRRLKYAKNPMEIKQLNKQLSMAYKKHGKGGSRNGIERR